MNLEDTIIALRLIPLDRGRLIELTRRAAYAPSDAARAQLVRDAQREAETAVQRRREAVEADYAELRAWRAYLEEHPAPREPEPALREPERYPEPRPVSIRWVTPTKASATHAKGCECTGCVNARRLAYLAKIEKLAHAPSHGVEKEWELGCRCTECVTQHRARNARYQAHWRARKAEKDAEK